MDRKPLIIATAETVQPPLMELREKVMIFPLIPQAWAGWQERIQLLSVHAPPETGLLETVRQTHAAMELLADVPDGERLAIQYFQASRAVNGFLEIFDALKAEYDLVGVVVHNDVEPLFRAACAWANANDVPAVHVPHAYYFQIWRDEDGWDIHDVVTAPYIAAINEAQKRRYRRLAKGRLKWAEVCGCPLWDRWASFRMPVARARKLLGLVPDQPTVTYIASWPQTTSLLGPPAVHQFQVFEAFALAAKALNWQLIVKAHPRGTEEIAQEHLRIMRNVKVKGVITKDHLGPCMQAADVVAAYGTSNALIEAAAGLNKPVLAVAAEARPLPYAAGDPDAIAVKLTELRGTEPSEQVRQLGPYIGEATQRVAKFLEEVFGLG